MQIERDTTAAEAPVPPSDAPLFAPERVPGIHSLPRHRGAHYLAVLESVHRHLKPRTYFEIGVYLGKSLKLASCPSIGVDPAMRDVDDLRGMKPAPLLVNETSDDFFGKFDPREMLGTPGIDFAFLDGLHLSEFLLRDVANAEKYMNPGGIIALHDCMPFDVELTRRGKRPADYVPTDYPPGLWARDVWRVVPALKKFRPDLRLTVLDAPPTGLVLVSGLEPNSTVLSDRYDEVLEYMYSLDLVEIGLQKHADSLDIQPSSAFVSAEGIGRSFDPFQ